MLDGGALAVEGIVGSSCEARLAGGGRVVAAESGAQQRRRAGNGALGEHDGGIGEVVEWRGRGRRWLVMDAMVVR